GTPRRRKAAISESGGVRAQRTRDAEQAAAQLLVVRWRGLADRIRICRFLSHRISLSTDGFVAWESHTPGLRGRDGSGRRDQLSSRQLVRPYRIPDSHRRVPDRMAVYTACLFRTIGFRVVRYGVVGYLQGRAGHAPE